MAEQTCPMCDGTGLVDLNSEKGWRYCECQAGQEKKKDDREWSEIYWDKLRDFI